MPTYQADIAIIGAGILGLAHALEAAKKGLKVVVFDRHQQPQGASVRNFGFFFPGGMPHGNILDRAMRSRAIWSELGAESGFWHEPIGAMIVAYAEDEWQVLKEFDERSKEYGYDCELLEKPTVLERSPYLNPDGLIGALFDKSAICLDPRDAIAKLPQTLSEKHGITFRFGQCVTQINLPEIRAGQESWHVQKVIVCTGADLSTLYPEVFETSPISLCKLQMMRTPPQPNHQRIGPMLAFGLTLNHYDSFQIAPSLPKLKERFTQEHADMLKRGIHVMATQHGDGTVVLGDSHDYGREVSPFDDIKTDEMVLDYLEERLRLPTSHIATRWHGIYAKDMKNGLFVTEPDKGVKIVNGIGGIGMTTSFGVAQEIIEEFI